MPSVFLLRRMVACLSRGFPPGDRQGNLVADAVAKAAVVVARLAPEMRARRLQALECLQVVHDVLACVEVAAALMAARGSAPRHDFRTPW